ncbi:MAG TPA: hypothetical protein VF002_04780 [Gaiellaceae bacterium]
MAAVGTFIPFEVPCYRCLRHHAEEQGLDPGVGEQLVEVPDVNAVIAPTAMLTGNLAALEAIYLLGDLRPQTIGRILHQNLIVYAHLYFIQPPFWKDCPACGSERTG